MLPESFTPAFLSQLELLQLRAKRAFLGTRHGGHRSLKRGHGIEFSDYRVYVPGDNPRDIDWGVYARSDRLYVKRFQEEQAFTAEIIIDTSLSMTALPQDRKWQRACEIGLALAYVALMQQDGVAVAFPGHVTVPPMWGARAIHDLSRVISNVRPDRPVDFVDGVRIAANAIKFPGIAIVISDFLMPITDIRQAANILRAKNLDITAIQVLGPNDVDPFPQAATLRALDSESGEEMDLTLDDDSRRNYRFALEQHNEDVKAIMDQSRISWATAPTDQDLMTFIIENLPRAGLLS